MKILQRLENDYKQALKNKDAITVSTLRMLKADLHNKEIEDRSKQLDDAGVSKVVAKQIKQHQDSIEQFKKGNREELVEKETKELQILKQYLPELLSEEEVTKVVKKIVAKVQANSPPDLGLVMKLAMAEFKGQADGKLVSQIVSSLLKSASDKKEN